MCRLCTMWRGHQYPQHFISYLQYPSDICWSSRRDFHYGGGGLREIQQISQSSAFHIENAFSGSPRYPALNDPREVLKMSVENKCNVKYHGMHVKSEWINCEKMTPFKWDINFFSICKLKQRWFRHYRGRYTSTVPKKWLQAHNWLSLSKGI